MTQEVFNRIEKKYLLNKNKMENLIKRMNLYIKLGKYPYSKICNIYFDTSNDELIRKSIEKPIYKEKVRLRSYGIPKEQDKVFLEIKKKFKGVVTKRRTELSLGEVNQYLENGVVPNNIQIFKEVDYCFKKYNLKPSIYISYERYSYVGKEDNNLRITFDTNILSREHDLILEKGDYGTSLLDENMYIMEIKCIGNMPIWLSHILAEMKIYPISFSKYGKIYQKNLKEEKIS